MTVYESLNAPVASLYIIAALFLIAGILIYFGKALFLIAGYNTLSKEEQDKYDKKKLGRVIGLPLTFIGLYLVFLGVFAKVLPVWTTLFIPVFVGIWIVSLGIGLMLSKFKE